MSFSANCGSSCAEERCNVIVFQLSMGLPLGGGAAFWLAMAKTHLD